MRDLDGYLPAHALCLLAAYEVDRETVDSVKELALRVFGKVDAVKQAGPGPAGWPRACNSMFQCAAKHIRETAKQPFLWVEPDSVPMREGWLNDIEAEYKRSGKAFMGTTFEWVGPNRRLLHLNGNAVYPADIARYNPYCLHANELPWDVVRPELTLRHAHISPLFQHTPGDPPFTHAWTFPDAGSMIRLRGGIAIFHRCKDGSLIRQLRTQKKLAHKSGNRPCNSCVICLGRYGDIMGALPIARDIAKRKRRPVHFVVAQEFASILDGCSYVVPDIWHGLYNQMPYATEMAQAKYKQVIRAQIFSTPEADPENRQPHNRRAWELAGYGERWKDKSLVLEFDKRDLRRERELIVRTIKRDTKPLLLLSLTSGNSGPFKDGSQTPANAVIGLSR